MSVYLERLKSGYYTTIPKHRPPRRPYGFGVDPAVTAEWNLSRDAWDNGASDRAAAEAALLSALRQEFEHDFVRHYGEKGATLFRLASEIEARRVYDVDVALAESYGSGLPNDYLPAVTVDDIAALAERLSTLL